MSSPKLPTTRQHLKDVHIRAAEHCVTMAKSHQAAATHFSTLSECCKAMNDGDADGDAAKAYMGMSRVHGSMADECTSQGEFHASCAKELGDVEKSAGSDDLAKIQPDGISGVTPTAPHSVRSVPRFGQREFSSEESPVAAGLEKILAVEE